MKKTLFILSAVVATACGTSRERVAPVQVASQYEFSTNIGGAGQTIKVDLKAGEKFYYPLMAIWIEDTQGKYIQTLYVARSVATGIFRFGGQEANRWVESPKRAPQTLPYWAHKRGVVASDGLFMPEPANPVADAYTGATPTTGFVLTAKADNVLSGGFKVMMEINQNWDWNQYWTNDRFPGDENYAMSAQPALVYEAVITAGAGEGTIAMVPVGHSHYSGKTGELFSDLSTLTTALRIVESVTVTVGR
ncbi:MAG: hypothetical protein IH591_11550 [Bacteroidales bacterium]|nr:hypothetical protein [Bacteroidales bacterium]